MSHDQATEAGPRQAPRVAPLERSRWDAEIAEPLGRLDQDGHGPNLFSTVGQCGKVAIAASSLRIERDRGVPGFVTPRESRTVSSRAINQSSE